MGHSGLHGGEGHGDNYFSPLQHANVKKIKGAEYSYLFDNIENAFTFPLREMEHIKAIVNVDEDEFDNNNFGYSLGYTKIYNVLFFSAVASRVNTDAYSSSKFMGSIQLIF